MSVDKKVNYDVQGGVKNYLGKQKEVTAPLKWQSSPDHPTTELAYITEAEKDLLVKSDLHGSLKGGVNKGPSGIMSLNGYGSYDDPSDPGRDTGMSGAATSDAEAGRTTANTRAEGPGRNLPPGVRDKGLDDYRNQFIAAGGGQRVNPGFFDDRNTVSPAELAMAKAYNPTAFKNTRGGGGITNFITGGGFLGNIVRNIGQRFGLGKRYNEPTYDMSGVSTNPNYYNNLDNELMLSTTATPQENKLNYKYDINDLASLIEASKQPQNDIFGFKNLDDQVVYSDYQDIGETSDSYNYPDRKQLVNSGTITPLEDDFPSEGIMGLDLVPTDEKIAARRFP